MGAGRIEFSQDDLNPLCLLLRIALVAEDERIPIRSLSSGLHGLPTIGRRTYDLLAERAQAFIQANRNFGLTERQRRNGWKRPSYSTYFRYVSSKEEWVSIPIEAFADILLIAKVMKERICRDQLADERIEVARRLIEQEDCDLAKLESRLLAACADALKSATPQKLPDSQIRKALHKRALQLSESIAERREAFVPVFLTEDRVERRENGHTAHYVYPDAASLLKETESYPVLAVIADPGRGKTTLLHQLEDCVLTAEDATAVPLMVSLSGYLDSEASSPIEWLEGAWTKAYGELLPSLRDTLANGRVLLLLDGFNEMGRPEAMSVWSRFIRHCFSLPSGNRAVVACRRLDYSTPIALEGRSVPQIRIERLTPSSIKEFVEKMRPDLAREFWGVVSKDQRLLKLYGTPMLLGILARVVETPADIWLSPARLFARLVWQLLRDELAKEPAAFDTPVLSRLDRTRISTSSVAAKTLLLPDEGRLIGFLSDLAFHMAGRTGVLLSEAKALMRDCPSAVADSIIMAACRCSLLHLDTEELILSFHHQLFQEFFAARRIAAEFDDALWTVPWKAAETVRLEDISDSEPIPALPGCGWEEATVMAVTFASEPQSFIERVYEQNPLLAASCAASSDAALSDEFAATIQRKMVEIMKDSDADMRARLQAGYSITDLEVLGYSDRITHLLPPVACLGGKTCIIGAEEREVGEILFHARRLCLPKHKATVEPFAASLYHVTNSEYARFVRAGGYDTDDWWNGDHAKRWLAGESLYDDLRWQLEQDIARHLEWPPGFIESQIGIRWPQSEAERMLRQMRWTEAEKDVWLRSEVERVGRPTHPEYWWNGEYSAPAQPVVGVSWFEACAYCRWLSSMTGESYRLLTEYEYEAAARGLGGWAYAYGDSFDPGKCNAFPSRIWKPSPVGLYETESPLYDLTGNAWVWTSGVDDENDPDGRRRMTVRGGSYDTSPELARTFCRDSNHPGYRDRYIGFRLAKGC